MLNFFLFVVRGILFVRGYFVLFYFSSCFLFEVQVNVSNFSFVFVVCFCLGVVTVRVNLVNF